jgi:hypothetical protein
MAQIEWKCLCGRRVTTRDRTPPRCPGDGITMTREWNTFAVARKPFTESHFNHSVGSVIHSDRQFRSELARKSDEMSERQGFEANFQPVDVRDKAACGVTDEGLDRVESRLRAEGKTETKRIVSL